eukprot:10242067-Alexandrium_andersonii.AAC.1
MARPMRTSSGARYGCAPSSPPVARRSRLCAARSLDETAARRSVSARVRGAPSHPRCSSQQARSGER